MKVLKDETIKLDALAFAQYVLFCEKIPLDYAEKKILTPGSDVFIRKLIKHKSKFMGPMTCPIGVLITTEMSASNVQRSLDVKHVDANLNLAFDHVDRIVPIIKIDILHTNPKIAWVRFQSLKIGDLQTICDYLILKVCEHVYEANGSRYAQDLEILLVTLEKDYDADIIFCSELSYFSHDKLTFISNYLKFMWCYDMNRDIFDPETYDELRKVNLFLTYSLRFLETNNLSNLPPSTTDPLHISTGERPGNGLNKFPPNKTYTIESTRGFQAIAWGTNCGTFCTHYEYISEVDIQTSFLEKII